MAVRRPRIPDELSERVDSVRGDVPFERWVRRAVEQALGDRGGPPSTSSDDGAVIDSGRAPGPVESAEEPYVPEWKKRTIYQTRPTLPIPKGKP